MKSRSLVVAGLGLMLTGPLLAQSPEAGMELAKKNNCLACHGMANKLVGPSWQDIAKKYAGDAEAEAKLVTKVRKGGKGVWGEVPMPPNVTVKEADVRTLVRFVLAVK